MTTYRVPQLAEFLIERFIRGNYFGFTTNLSDEMLLQLTILNDEEIEKQPFGAAYCFPDLHTIMERADQTVIYDEKLNMLCKKILSDVESFAHAKIAQYLDRHLVDIGCAEDVEKWGLNIDKKAQIIARHRVEANLIKGPPRNDRTEFRIVLSRMIDPDNGPMDSANLWFPYSMLFEEFRERLRIHTVREPDKLDGFTEKDGPFIFRHYHVKTGLPLTEYKKLDVNNYQGILRDYREQGNIAVVWHSRDYAAYEKNKAKHQKGKEEAALLEMLEIEDEGFSEEEGRLLDELLKREQESIERQGREEEAGSKMGK